MKLSISLLFILCAVLHFSTGAPPGYLSFLSGKKEASIEPAKTGISPSVLMNFVTKKRSGLPGLTGSPLDLAKTGVNPSTLMNLVTKNGGGLPGLTGSASAKNKSIFSLDMLKRFINF